MTRNRKPAMRHQVKMAEPDVLRDLDARKFWTAVGVALIVLAVVLLIAAR